MAHTETMGNMGTAQQRAKTIKKFGLRIRGLREARGWTLEQTEEHGPLTWQYLQKIEAGRNITLVTVIKLAETFRVPLEDLFKDLF